MNHVNGVVNFIKKMQEYTESIPKQATELLGRTAPGKDCSYRDAFFLDVVDAIETGIPEVQLALPVYQFEQGNIPIVVLLMQQALDKQITEGLMDVANALPTVLSLLTDVTTTILEDNNAEFHIGVAISLEL